MLKTGPGPFDYTVVGVASNATPPPTVYSHKCQYTYIGGITKEWIEKNTALDENGEPLPGFAEPECDVFYDPSGNGTEWEKFFEFFDMDKDTKMSKKEFELMYEEGTKVGCLCETFETTFARYD